MLLFLLSWAYITAFHYLAQDSFADTQILLNVWRGSSFIAASAALSVVLCCVVMQYAQFVFLILSSKAGNITSFLSIFNFNLLGATQSTCIAPLSDLERLSSGLFVPLIGFGFLIINCGLHALRWWLVRTNRCCCSDRCIALMPDVSGDSFWPLFRAYRRTTLGFIASSCKRLRGNPFHITLF